MSTWEPPAYLRVCFVRHWAYPLVVSSPQAPVECLCFFAQFREALRRRRGGCEQGHQRRALLDGFARVRNVGIFGCIEIGIAFQRGEPGTVIGEYEGLPSIQDRLAVD